MRLEGKKLVVAMCVGQIGNLLPHVAVPAVMVQHLIPLWNLSASEAGLMASAFSLGYMLSVPVLATLTDRIDSRLILLVGSPLSVLATCAFGLFADGLVSATALWGLAGVGFAGSYMPGLKALTDRLGSGDISRSVTLYTSSFSLGVGLSFLVAQVAADTLGWRVAFLIVALGPLAMIATAVKMRAVTMQTTTQPLLNFGPVFRNRTAVGYILGYGAHCFELAGFRTWIVAFWAFVAARHGGHTILDPIALSVVVTVLAMPASMAGNEVAIRLGRHRAITGVMVCAGTIGAMIGLAAGGSPALLLVLVVAYSLAIPADSGALTSGMSAAAEPANRGATMALHSTIGFGLTAAGGWAFGVALDAGGGISSPLGWSAGFALMAAGGLLGPLALWWSRRGAERPRQTVST